MPLKESSSDLTDRDILFARPAKNAVDPRRPYAFLVEPERSPAGIIEDVATIFLTNRECPFRCLMCDLWKNTTDERVPLGAVPEQVAYALARLPPARHVKLYNSGNFFDRQAIPAEDYAAIAEHVRPFQTVIVENHPLLCDEHCLEFRDLLAGELEVAIGLETIHPEVLPRLNKRMTVGDFQRAVGFLARHNIATRAFLLLRPPFLSEAEGIEWSVRSMELAFAAGVRCCSVIPTRDGNGVMEKLRARGDFEPPSLAALEEVLRRGLEMGGGRVFVDLWDIERLGHCSRCGPARRERLRQMNLAQRVPPSISCVCGSL